MKFLGLVKQYVFKKIKYQWARLEDYFKFEDKLSFIERICFKNDNKKINKNEIGRNLEIFLLISRGNKYWIIKGNDRIFFSWDFQGKYGIGILVMWENIIVVLFFFLMVFLDLVVCVFKD